MKNIVSGATWKMLWRNAMIFSINGLRFLQILTDMPTKKRGLQKYLANKMQKAKLLLKKLKTNPSTATINRTLKNQSWSNQPLNMEAGLSKLNDFFLFIGPKLSEQVPKPQHGIDIPCFEKRMLLSDTNQDEVARIVIKMKNKKTSAYDGISNEARKYRSPVVEEHLPELFNECLETRFPKSLKKAKVIALHKESDSSDPKNYRLISILISLSKVYEKLLGRTWNDF